MRLFVAAVGIALAACAHDTFVRDSARRKPRRTAIPQGKTKAVTR
jgi:hypothetical protein